MIGVKILEERKSPINGKIQVIRSLGLGTYIQADGITQSGGIVESFWRKTLKRILNSKLQIKNCLILGLGGGSAAKWVRKLWPEAKITGVDIDPVMVELGSRYLNLDTSKTKIIIANAANYTLYAKRYDLILVDLYVADKFPEKFKTDEFLRLVKQLMTKDSIAIFNRLYYGDKRPLAVKFGQKLQKIFPKVDAFYPEANIMYICSY